MTLTLPRSLKTLGTVCGGAGSWQLTLTHEVVAKGVSYRLLRHSRGLLAEARPVRAHVGDVPGLVQRLVFRSCWYAGSKQTPREERSGMLAT